MVFMCIEWLAYTNKLFIPLLGVLAREDSVVPKVSTIKIINYQT